MLLLLTLYSFKKIITMISSIIAFTKNKSPPLFQSTISTLFFSGAFFSISVTNFDYLKKLYEHTVNLFSFYESNG